jgi:hypothetical protein
MLKWKGSSPRPGGFLGHARSSSSACDPHGKKIRDVLDQHTPRGKDIPLDYKQASLTINKK